MGKNRVLWPIFYFEALINLCAAVTCFTAPAFFLSSFTGDLVPPVPLEIVRWYGVLLFVFAWLMVRGLRTGGKTIAILLEGFLAGDLLHLCASFLFFRAGGGLNPASIMMVLVTVLLIPARISYLAGSRKGDTEPASP